jgi:hypothetical protein
MSIIYKGNGQVLNLIFANVTGSLKVTGHGIRVPLSRMISWHNASAHNIMLQTRRETRV